MALQIIFSFLVVFLSFSTFMVEPSRHFGVQAPISDGLCASAVVVHGYKCQEFEVTTEDGYVLSMQRISAGRVGGGGKKKQPVLLQHGVLVDGMSWLMTSPEQSLPLILADNGYDVWIANFRGTRFSGKHATLDPASPEYWNWSWDDLAAYDLPATLNFVYTQTGQKIDYVGHSMGTLVALASLSEGRLLDRLNSAALLSPVAYLSHMRTPIGVIAAHAFIGEIHSWLGIAEYNLREKIVMDILSSICANHGINCYDLLTTFTGKNCCLNASTVDLFLKNGLQPTSVKNMVHLAQTVRDGIFSKFDYGMAHNMQQYGQSSPPVYNLTNIPKSFPIFISYGGEDALSDVEDVSLLLESLRLHDRDKLRVKFVKDYAHADFIMGVTAKEIVYNPLIEFFKEL